MNSLHDEREGRAERDAKWRKEDRGANMLELAVYVVLTAALVAVVSALA